MKVVEIEKFPIDVPFAEHVWPHMERALTHGTRLYVYRVHTGNGLVGVGDSLQDEGEKIPRYLNRDPSDLLFEEASFGIQTAIWDLVGKHLGVPLYKLLGRKLRDYVPISWWSIDMPPSDWVDEARTAARLGYRSHKIKARPWRDIVEQVDALSKAMPSDFRLTVDANAFFLTAGKAVPTLKELEAYPNVECFETPIPQSDIEGYKVMRSKLSRPIAIHYGVPPPLTAIREGVCDAFVIGGPLGAVLQQAAIAREANKPFWLQMVGSGITTAFALHLGAVLSHATMPAVTCHELWVDDLVKEHIDVSDGYARVPEKPGLGVELDEEAVEKYRVALVRPRPRQVLLVKWPDGRRHYFRHESDVQRVFHEGSEPGFERGVSMEVVADDGSDAFNKLYDTVQRAPVWHKD